MGVSPFLWLFVACCCLADVRHIHLTVGWIIASPDGFSREILAVNNTFPGPLLEFNSGDNVVINVFNTMNQSTSMHWHGFLQRGTPYMDGPAGVTQCPIPPRSHFTYNFIVRQHGSYWYHSHTGTQYKDGCFGPIIVRNSEGEIYQKLYREDVFITLLGWYHTLSSKLLASYLSPESKGHEPNPDSALMNGHGVSGRCVDPNVDLDKLYMLTVRKGNGYRLRLLNPSAFAAFSSFSIDGHSLTVIEADGTDTEPYVIDSITLNIAERYSVILNADKPIGNYWIRANISIESLSFGGEPNHTLCPWVVGVLHYEGAKSEAPNTSPTQNLVIFNETLLRPYISTPVPSPVGREILLRTYFAENAEGVTLAYFNNISFVFPKGQPTLYAAKHGATTFPAQNNVITLSNRGEVIEVTLLNYDMGEHPFHLHGHMFYVIGKASVPPGEDGECSTEEVDRLRIQHPNYRNLVARDVTTVQGCGKLVFRFVANNPGVWFFHCHISWHLEAGLALLFNELSSDLPNLPCGTCNSTFCGPISA